MISPFSPLGTGIPMGYSQFSPEDDLRRYEAVAGEVEASFSIGEDTEVVLVKGC